MKKYLVLLSTVSFFIIYSSSLFAGDVLYVREGNKIVPIEGVAADIKNYADLRSKLTAMDANLARKKAEEEGIVTTVGRDEYNQHIANTEVHHERYSDAEAINAVQGALNLSFKSISDINAEGGDVKYFEKTEGDQNSSVSIYGKGLKDADVPKFGKLKIDSITGEFSITNSPDEEISIDASNDLNLNSNANGNVVLFNDNSTAQDKHLFIYKANSKNYASIGYVSGTDNFQIANSKEGGNLLLVTKKGSILADGNLMCTSDIFANCNGPDKDSSIYFYANNKPNGAFLKYSAEKKSFEFSTPHMDIAEKVEMGGLVEPGDVVVFEKNKEFKRSSQSNSKYVIGVVSLSPAFIIGGEEKGYPLALCGQVEVKVCDQNGDIKAGDFLTTSDLPGYAMRSTELAPGSIIGQSMEEFSGDKGTVKMVVKMR